MWTQEFWPSQVNSVEGGVIRIYDMAGLNEQRSIHKNEPCIGKVAFVLPGPKRIAIRCWQKALAIRRVLKRRTVVLELHHVFNPKSPTPSTWESSQDMERKVGVKAKKLELAASKQVAAGLLDMEY